MVATTSGCGGRSAGGAGGGDPDTVGALTRGRPWHTARFLPLNPDKAVSFRDRETPSPILPHQRPWCAYSYTEPPRAPHGCGAVRSPVIYGDHSAGLVVGPVFPMGPGLDRKFLRVRDGSRDRPRVGHHRAPLPVLRH